MKFDTTVKELQKEKADLEAKLKQVNVALAALAKLGGKQSAVAPEKGTTGASAAQPATTTKPGVSPTPPTTKPSGS